MKNKILLALIIYSLNAQGQTSLYITTNFTAQIIKVDMPECTQTVIGTMLSPMVDIATCPDGSMYGVDGVGLYSINTTNAVYTPVNFTGTALTFMNSLVCDRTGQLYASGGEAIYKVDKIT